MNTYILVIRIHKTVLIKIGALGYVNFSKGYYVYVGSARKGLKKRIDRHLNNTKKLHWHIDYLTLHSKPIIIGLTSLTECKAANILQNENNIIDKFGSSDCKCRSHLFYFVTLDKCMKYLNALNLRIVHNLEYSQFYYNYVIHTYI